MIIELKDFITHELADKIENLIASPNYVWYWRPSSAYGCSPRSEFSEDFQFINMIYYGRVVDQEAYALVSELIKVFEQHTKIKVRKVYRAKANLLTKQMLSDAGLDETIHVDISDMEGKYVSLVYYVSDSDGDTVIYAEEGAVTKAPIKGTAICFPSDLKHRATPPVAHKRRVVLNIVLEVE